MWRICAKLLRPFMLHVCILPAPIPECIPLRIVCECRAEPFVSYDKWSCALQTCTFSTQLNGPLRSLNAHSLARDPTRDWAKANTEGPIWGYCPSHDRMQHSGWKKPLGGPT